MSNSGPNVPPSASSPNTGSQPVFSTRAAVLIAFAGPLAAAAIMVPLRGHVQTSSLALIMVLVVAASLLPGNRGAGLVAGVSAGPWFDFFLTNLTRPFPSLAAPTSKPPCCSPSSR